MDQAEAPTWQRWFHQGTDWAGHLFPGPRNGGGFREGLGARKGYISRLPRCVPKYAAIPPPLDMIGTKLALLPRCSRRHPAIVRCSRDFHGRPPSCPPDARKRLGCWGHGVLFALLHMLCSCQPSVCASGHPRPSRAPGPWGPRGSARGTQHGTCEADGPSLEHETDPLSRPKGPRLPLPFVQLGSRCCTTPRPRSFANDNICAVPCPAQYPTIQLPWACSFFSDASWGSMGPSGRMGDPVAVLPLNVGCLSHPMTSAAR